MRVTLFYSLSINLMVMRKKMGGKNVFMRIISLSEAWLSVTSIRVSWLCIEKKIFCVNAWLQIWYFFESFWSLVLLRGINRNWGLLSRNSSGILHLFLWALSRAWALCASSDRWSADGIISQRSCTSSLGGTCYFRSLKAHCTHPLMCWFCGSQSDLLIFLNYFVVTKKQLNRCWIKQ